MKPYYGDLEEFQFSKVKHDIWQLLIWPKPNIDWISSFGGKEITLSHLPLLFSLFNLFRHILCLVCSVVNTLFQALLCSMETNC